MIPTQGPMGRTVADTCLLLSAQAAFDARDPLSRRIEGAQFIAPRPIDPSRLRIGFTLDWGTCPIDPGIARTFQARIARLAPMVRSCKPVTPDMRHAHEAFGVLRATGMLHSQPANYLKHRHRLGPNMIANYEEGLRYSAANSHLKRKSMRQTRSQR